MENRWGRAERQPRKDAGPVFRRAVKVAWAREDQLTDSGLFENNNNKPT